MDDVFIKVTTGLETHPPGGEINELAGGDVAVACENVALTAWRALNCADGGRVDLRCDSRGIPNFIEVNPLAGLDKVHSDLPILSYLHGYDFEQIIGEIMHSAKKRTGLL